MAARESVQITGFGEILALYSRFARLITSAGVVVWAFSAAATRFDTASAVARTMSADRST